MPKFTAFNTQAIHKLFMLTGIVAAAATLYLAWTLLSRIEPQAMDILRQQILAELDLQSFHRQLQSLEAEERQAAADYSPQQLEILKADVQVLQKETRAATERLGQISLKRAELTGNIKITLLITLIVLSASLMLIIFGFIGWYFRIRILEEPGA
jgi:thioredoxin-like negative regulator of GroEL